MVFLKDFSKKNDSENNTYNRRQKAWEKQQQWPNSKVIDNYNSLFQKISKTGGVEKMTDTSQYTGSHQARFDSSGKGKGIEGRTTKVDSSGYVGAYKGSGTYGKK